MNRSSGVRLAPLKKKSRARRKVDLPALLPPSRIVRSAIATSMSRRQRNPRIRTAESLTSETYVLFRRIYGGSSSQLPRRARRATVDQSGRQGAGSWRPVALTEEEWVGYRRTIAAQSAQMLACLATTPSVTESRNPSTTRALPPKPVRKPTKWPRSQQAMSEVRRCLRTRAGHLGNREADSRRLRAWRALHRQNRYAKPMELPPNLTAVYLGEFKRALAWASCRRPTREFWQ